MRFAVINSARRYRVYALRVPDEHGLEIGAKVPDKLKAYIWIKRSDLLRADFSNRRLDPI
jgi:hypothetical protein